MTKTPLDKTPLKLLFVVIPAQNEESCIASTAKRLYLELAYMPSPEPNVKGWEFTLFGLEKVTIGLRSRQNRDM